LISVYSDPPVLDVDCLRAKAFRGALTRENGELVGLVSGADLMPAILEAQLAPEDEPDT